MIACDHCAAQNPDGSRFCNQCGHALSTSGPAPAAAGYTPRHLVERVLRDRSALLGERKQVTVLFADLKDSTRLAEQAGAEGWHSILDRFFGLLAAAVHRYEGTINQYTGDGIMALFGAPLAHEDHAARACLAALQMRDEMQDFATDLSRRNGLELRLRIGLNSGEVVVGRIGDDLRMDYTAQGTTVHLAARLEQRCEPGQIYLSRATAARVEGLFDLRALDALTVPGMTRPVEALALLGRVTGGVFDERRRASGPEGMFGREDERAGLIEALAASAAGHGQSVALVGDAGFGKSRLIDDLVDAARRDGIDVHRTTASPYARHQPMAGPRELYLSCLGVTAQTAAALVRERIEAELPMDLRSQPGVLSFVLAFAGVEAADRPSEAQAAALREPLMDRLADTLARRAKPQVLVFEDLQHLDPIALRFVERLARGVASTPTLLLLSWRRESPPSTALAVDRVLELGPVPADALLRLAAAWTGRHPSLDGLSERIAARAAGNPYFVEEAVRTLAETGLLEGRPSDYRAMGPIDQLPVPDSVQALIAARIDRLPPAQKGWLQAAAVIGEDFDADLLAALADRPPDAAEVSAPDLSGLAAAGFLRRQTGAWNFVQPLLREVAYGMQLADRRRELHARLAQALALRCADRPLQDRARGVADHWRLARDWLQAAHWNLHAARWFAARDPQVTLEQFRLALQHTAAAADAQAARPMRVAALAGLLRVAIFVELPDDELDRAYAEASVLAPADVDPAGAAELDISYSSQLLQRGQVERAVDLVDRALQRASPKVRRELSERFRLPILMAYGSMGRFARGIEQISRAGDARWWRGPVDNDNSGSRLPGPAPGVERTAGAGAQ